MELDWTAVGSVAAVLSVLASLWALSHQVKSLRKSAESATYQEMIRMFNDFSCMLVNDPELERHVFAKEALPDGSDQDIRTKASWMLGMRFVWFESMVIQKRVYGALHDDIYSHWLTILKEELETKSVEEYWKRCGSKFHPRLREEIRCLRPDIHLKEGEPEPQPS